MTGARRGRDAGWREPKLLALLGLPTFAFALAITTVSTYLPLLAGSFAASTTVIGLLIGGGRVGPPAPRTSS